MRRELGESCGKDDICLNSTCIQGICRSQKPDSRQKEKSKAPLAGPCKEDADCERGLICWASHCVKKCNVSTDCPVGAFCIVVGSGERICTASSVAPEVEEVDMDADSVVLNPYLLIPTAMFMVLLVIWVAYAIYRDIFGDKDDAPITHPVIKISDPPAQPIPERTSIYIELSPAGTTVIPEPFMDGLPRSPIEKQVFSDVNNMAATIETVVPAIEVLSMDPELDSQKLWE